MSDPRYPRPRPVIGDTTSAGERRRQPAGWAMGEQVTQALDAVIAGRRDIRRFRPDPVPGELLDRVLRAGHAAPSVGHSQPWRFIVVTSASLRDKAAHLADRARLEQASQLTTERAGRLLDLKLEGLREAPIGIVVACDRRTPPAGVLGRATFPDTDLWSCACAIQNMWLTARSAGLGMGWVTLFDPAELAALVRLPEGVTSLGWLCLGWPDERPPSPGLERAAWSRKLGLDEVVMHDVWRDDSTPPPSYLRGPVGESLVAATDDADELLSPPESLGLLDRALSRIVGLGGESVDAGTLVLAAADHPVAALGVSAYPVSVTRSVVQASVAGQSLGARAAQGAGLDLITVDAGVAGEPVPGTVAARPSSTRGDLMTAAAMTAGDAAQLLAAGQEIGRRAARSGLVALGEAGVGNTTVAAALVCGLLHEDARQLVGVGAGSDAGIVDRKVEVVTAALQRAGAHTDPLVLLAELGGGEFAVLAGVVMGAASAGAPVVLDGLATSVAALVAVRLEPGVQGYLIAGQSSREIGHTRVLRELGLEPLLSLRLRSGEGVGAALASSLLLQGLRIRRSAARTD